MQSVLAYRVGQSSYYLTINKFADQSKHELKVKFAIKQDNIVSSSMVELNNKAKKRHKRATQMTHGACTSNEPIAASNTKNSVENFFNSLAKTFTSQKVSVSSKKNLLLVDWSGMKGELVDDKSSSSRLSPTVTEQQVGCYLTKPINQADCACCYAVASVKLFEWLYCFARASNKQQNNDELQVKERPMMMSEQFIIDCGLSLVPGLEGCVSGSVGSTLDFIQSVGLIQSTDLPYAGKVNECKFDLTTTTSSREEKNRGILLIKPEKMTTKILKKSADWEQAVLKQPLIVYLQLSDRFFDYGGGVYKETKCDAENGHVAVLAGFGYENNQKYWLLENSFGLEWGIEGYMKLSAQSSDCVVYMLQVEASKFTISTITRDDDNNNNIENKQPE